jgi:hypothetical protein
MALTADGQIAQLRGHWAYMLLARTHGAAKPVEASAATSLAPGE